MLPIRAWLKVCCNKAAGSRALGRDSALPHLPPEAGKNPLSKAFASVPVSPSLGEIIHRCARRAGLQQGVAQSSTYKPHTTSPSASRPAARGTPGPSPKPSGFIDPPNSTSHTSVAFQGEQVYLPALAARTSPGRHASAGSCPPAANPLVCKSHPRYRRNANSVCQR